MEALPKQREKDEPAEDAAERDQCLRAAVETHRQLHVHDERGSVLERASGLRQHDAIE